MWGNRLGWLISLVIVAAAAVALGVIANRPGVATPTEWSADPAHFEPISFPLLRNYVPLPSDVDLGADPGKEDGDQLIRQAIGQL